MSSSLTPVALTESFITENDTEPDRDGIIIHVIARDLNEQMYPIEWAINSAKERKKL